MIKYRRLNADCRNVGNGFLIDNKPALGKNMKHILAARCRPDTEKHYYACINKRLNRLTLYGVQI